MLEPRPTGFGHHRRQQRIAMCRSVLLLHRRIDRSVRVGNEKTIYSTINIQSEWRATAAAAFRNDGALVSQASRSF